MRKKAVKILESREKSKDAPKNGRIGYSNYTRRCIRCQLLYSTPFRHSKICPKCIDNRSPIKRMMMEFSELKERFDREIDEDIEEIKKSVVKKA